MAHIIYKDTAELFYLIEDIKAMQYVNSMSWSETVNVIGDNNSEVISAFLVTSNWFIELSTHLDNNNDYKKPSYGPVKWTTRGHAHRIVPLCRGWSPFARRKLHVKLFQYDFWSIVFQLRISRNAKEYNAAV